MYTTRTNSARIHTYKNKRKTKKHERRKDTTCLLHFWSYFLFVSVCSDSIQSKMHANAVWLALQAQRGAVKPMLEYSSGSETGQWASQDVILRRHMSAYRGCSCERLMLQRRENRLLQNAPAIRTGGAQRSRRP